MRRSRIQNYLMLALLGLVPLRCYSAEALLAVAANFSVPARAIATQFEQVTGHKILVSQGSSGKLYAQIRNGAPFDVFLSADQKHPQLLLEQGLAVVDSRFTYAHGALALWSAKNDMMLDEHVLARQEFKKIALANPDLAPYGLAALQALESMKLDKALQKKMVYGENISQTYQFVASGNAELGFVALSQVFTNEDAHGGSYWRIPSLLHEAIAQDAVLLLQGSNNEAAQAFMNYLSSAEAVEIITRYGYSGDALVAEERHDG